MAAPGCPYAYNDLEMAEWIFTKFDTGGKKYSYELNRYFIYEDLKKFYFGAFSAHVDIYHSFLEKDKINHRTDIRESFKI